MARGLGKKTKCSIAGGQLASNTTAKQTKKSAGAKLGSKNCKTKK
jgi:hypothetical protein